MLRPDTATTSGSMQSAIFVSGFANNRLHRHHTDKALLVIKHVKIGNLLICSLFLDFRQGLSNRIIGLKTDKSPIKMFPCLFIQKSSVR